MAGALFLLFTGVSIWLAVAEESRSNWVRHTVETQLRLVDLAALARDAESGERGYLLTGDETYLAPWRRTHGQVAAMLDATARSVSDNPTQQWALAALRGPFEAKFAEMAETIRLRQAGDAAGAKASLASGRGLALMAQIWTRLSAMRGEEDRLLIERTRGVLWARGRLPAAVALAGMFALLCIMLWMRAVRAGAQALRASNQQVLQVNVGLDEGRQQLLAEMERRRVIEDQLHQAQKMEALGQLTGGIAHDFNNRLSVVIGNLDLLLHRATRAAASRDGCGRAEIERHAGRAIKDAKRAAELTQHLLAFARQQVLVPEILEPNRLIANMSDLLRRTLGAQVTVATVLPNGLWRLHIDRNQLENALLNLAINGRDAMGADGGRLTIETANVHLDSDDSVAHPGVPAGQYVLIAVVDTGTGMDPETARRAIEPFFTTKGLGQGTGLGLSQVYGFTNQSGGHLKLCSQPGRGTTVKLYLPRQVSEVEGSLATREEEAALAVTTGRPLVLVVEDEEAVRWFSVEALAELGCDVLEADGAVAALALLDAHPEVALLLTDVAMPGMDGGKLAKEAMRRRPNLPVLFTTGHTRGAMMHNGTLAPGAEVLSKPFTLSQLGQKVRHMLDRRCPPYQTAGGNSARQTPAVVLHAVEAASGSD